MEKNNRVVKEFKDKQTQKRVFLINILVVVFAKNVAKFQVI